MKPIRVFTSSFELVAEIDNYEYLTFSRRWHTVGEFELRINRYKKDTDKLVKNNIILIGNQNHKVFIIKHREIGLDEKGKQSEQWVIKGYSLQGILNQRITVPPSTTAYDNKSGRAETVMKHYVNNHVINPVDASRKIDQVSMNVDVGRGSSVSWQSRYKNLAEELAEISLVTGLGWLVYLDYKQRKWVFDVVEGRDLTANNGNNPPVIFSPDFDSIKNQSFADSDFNYKNYGYVGGQGEGAERYIVTIGNSTGLDRIETFIDARDIEDNSQLPIRGQQKMKEFETELYLEAEILTPIKRIEYEHEHHFLSRYQTVNKSTRKEVLYGSFIYEEDYDLGDIVTIQNRRWGVTRDARITQLKEIYEPNGFKLEAVFGQSRPTLISKIKQQLSQLEAEVKR